MRSLINDWLPNPTAKPTIPADARSGIIFMLNAESNMRMVMTRMTIVVAFWASESTVRVRGWFALVNIFLS